MIWLSQQIMEVQEWLYYPQWAAVRRTDKTSLPDWDQNCLQDMEVALEPLIYRQCTLEIAGVKRNDHVCLLLLLVQILCMSS